MFPTQGSESVLLVTLDSLRFDTAARGSALAGLGAPLCAMAPSHFTFGSHAAMWVGTTPGIPGLRRPFLDPKWGRLFQMVNSRIPSRSEAAFALPGRNIIQGFAQKGYRTLGTGAVDWFDPQTPTGAWLVQDFQHFYFTGQTSAIDDQLVWLAEQLGAESGPVFCFLNAGETHVPYYHAGADYSPHDNPCVPYGGSNNNRSLCEQRQLACFEYVARAMEPLVRSFAAATVLVTADHGDCWGEDGLWEHGTWHRKTMEVPLWLRVRGVLASLALE